VPPIDARDNCCLSGGALRPAFNSEARVGGDNHSIVDRVWFLSAKYRQRLSMVETVERIEWSTPANPQAINEKE